VHHDGRQVQRAREQQHDERERSHAAIDQQRNARPDAVHETSYDRRRDGGCREVSADGGAGDRERAGQIADVQQRAETLHAERHAREHRHRNEARDIGLAEEGAVAAEEVGHHRGCRPRESGDPVSSAQAAGFPLARE
jgi:hypothetical protein